MVGDGQGVEAVRRGLADEVVDATEAVEEAELRVQVEVDEVVGGDGHGMVMVARSDGSVIGVSTATARRTGVHAARPDAPL